MRFIFFTILLLTSSILWGQKNPRKIKLPAVLEEVSGAWFASPDSLWWHNDGGHPAALICTNRRGEIVDEIAFPSLRNKDWEDLTVDDKGNVYIGDFGNNRNKRRDLKVYIYNRYSQDIDSISFHYDNQKEFPPKIENWNFNMEAFFYHDDSLHLFSKNKVQYGDYMVKHYILPAKPGNFIAKTVDSLDLRNRVITGSAIRRDGKVIALVGYNHGRILGIPWGLSSVYIITDFPRNRFLSGHIKKKRAPGFIFPRQYESLDFIDDNTLYIGSEKIFGFRQKARRFKIKKHYLKK